MMRSSLTARCLNICQSRVSGLDFWWSGRLLEVRLLLSGNVQALRPELADCSNSNERCGVWCGVLDIILCLDS
ncbi:hypothetical protein BJY04DRAFT_186866 [Aspergillus karnatakaensis]|uniref:uncharacterized protein n=1 Tax=Aspergillus karnatakaensis TaxID=1810916 RepID=UPI003CCDEE95